ncbi:phosphotransferase enzyme family protein [Pseudoruegeria sp. HB172150]|uniref:phosphotransferase enzyme family protein n=1 Tax=Pseudoruegeria sp. HB172150 TaxID=2721164 RepID=UPI001554470D|nr:phosphotransferase [Pseudoruegeria sp. HB172150]
MSTTRTNDTPHAAAEAAVLSLLSNAGRMAPLTIARIPRGQGTVNYRVETNMGRFFVKSYLPGADLAAENAAIALSERARQTGIATAHPVRFASGCYVAQDAGNAISVWHWIEGEVRTKALGSAALHEIGYVLGRLHTALRGYSNSLATANKTHRFLATSEASVRAQIDSIENALQAEVHQTGGTVFDITAARALVERRVQLRQLPRIMKSLPALSSQVVHGDYTTLNLLFEGDRVCAVLDFRPPEPFLVSWELGRIAFNPDLIATSDDWLKQAQAVIEGYLDAGDGLAREDILFCGRVALIQLLKSLYGIKQHYLAPALLQDDLDVFWAERHVSVSRMLAQLDEVDSMLVSVTK